MTLDRITTRAWDLHASAVNIYTNSIRMFIVIFSLSQYLSIAMNRHVWDDNDT